VVESLLATGADVNAPAGRGWTALHFAAERGHTSVSELLLARGAHPRARTTDGHTPLDLATFYEHTPVMRLLRRYAKRVPRTPSDSH
jgi:ankyrin repeat protein